MGCRDRIVDSSSRASGLALWLALLGTLLAAGRLRRSRPGACSASPASRRAVAGPESGHAKEVDLRLRGDDGEGGGTHSAGTPAPTRDDVGAGKPRPTAKGAETAPLQEEGGEGTQSSALSPQSTTHHPSLITHHSRRRKLALLTGLLGALALVLGFGGHYLLGGARTSAAGALPPITEVAPQSPPRFLFSINGVSRPLGVAVSPSGDRIYVTESDGDRETKLFDRDGNLLGSLNPPDTSAASRTPVYVAAAPDGKVYVSDRRADTVHVYSPDGEYLGKLQPGGMDGGWAPLAIGFNPLGNLLATVVAPGVHSVVALGPDGGVATRFGRQGAGDGEFNYPNGIAADQQGRLLVADSNNGRIAVHDSAGNLLWYFGDGAGGAGVALPRGLAVDDRDRAYVADTMGHTVQVYQLGENEAKHLFSLGSQGLKDGQFNFPNGIALDSAARLYITDRENNRVQVWTY